MTLIWIVVNLFLGGLCYCDFPGAMIIGGILLLIWNVLMAMVAFECDPITALIIVVIVFGSIYGLTKIMGIDDPPANAPIVAE